MPIGRAREEIAQIGRIKMGKKTKFCAIFSGDQAETDVRADVKHEMSFIKPALLDMGCGMNHRYRKFGACPLHLSIQQLGKRCTILTYTVLVKGTSPGLNGIFLPLVPVTKHLGPLKAMDDRGLKN